MIRRIRRPPRSSAAALLAAGPATAAQQGHRAPASRSPRLQGQIAEIQRAVGGEPGELRRLTELLAEQNALLKKSVAGPETAGRGRRRHLKDLGDRVAEVAEALDAIKAQAAPLLTPLPAADAAPAGTAVDRARDARRRSRDPGRGPSRRAGPRPARALQPGLRRLRPRQLRPRDPGLRRVHPELPRHRLLRQRAVLDRRVPVREAEVRRGDRGLEHPLPRLPVERQAAGRARQEGHGPREARPHAARRSSSTATWWTATPTRRRRASPASGSPRS